MAQTYERNDRFPPVFFESIGRVTVAFGRLEYVLKLAIKRLGALPFDEAMFEVDRKQFRDLAEIAKQRFAQQVSEPRQGEPFWPAG